MNARQRAGTRGDQRRLGEASRVGSASQSKVVKLHLGPRYEPVEVLMRLARPCSC